MARSRDDERKIARFIALSTIPPLMISDRITKERWRDRSAGELPRKAVLESFQAHQPQQIMGLRRIGGALALQSRTMRLAGKVTGTGFALHREFFPAEVLRRTQKCRQPIATKRSQLCRNLQCQPVHDGGGVRGSMAAWCRVAVQGRLQACASCARVSASENAGGNCDPKPARRCA